MISSPAPLTLDDIRSTLATIHLGQRLYVHRELPSTNREALHLAEAGAEHGTVVVADSQTAGRGRQARVWFSPPGGNLYCSILIRPRGIGLPFSEWLSWIPLAAAVAATETVRGTTGIALALKWPNDLLLHERKIGGILCENGADARGEMFVVIGIGLNVNASIQSFPPELAATAGSLVDAVGQPIDRNRLLAQLLGDLEQLLDELAAEGARRLRPVYTDRCATIGKRVRVLLAEGRELVGQAEDIGADGSLLVRPSEGAHGRGLIEVRAADVRHLRE